MPNATSLQQTTFDIDAFVKELRDLTEEAAATEHELRWSNNNCLNTVRVKPRWYNRK